MNRMVDRYRNYQPRRAQKKRPKKKVGRYILLITVLIAVFFVVKSANKSTDNTKTQYANKASNVQKKIKTVKAEAISSTTWQDLEAKISGIIAQSELDIAVGIVDIKSGTAASYGVKESFHGASTTKVLTAIAYLHDVETGKRTLAQNLGGGSAEVHIKRMINRSDNNSWEILNQAVGYSRLNAYASANGISSYKYIGNLMTASDEALLLAKLYSRKLLNEDHTKLLLSYMQNTNNEDMIPMVNPGGTLYHKYGQLEDRLHDAAIIDYKEKPIALVIYTKGKSDGNVYSTRTQFIQSIAAEVFAIIYK